MGFENFTDSEVRTFKKRTTRRDKLEGIKGDNNITDSTICNKGDMVCTKQKHKKCKSNTTLTSEVKIEKNGSCKDAMKRKTGKNKNDLTEEQPIKRIKKDSAEVDDKQLKRQKDEAQNSKAPSKVSKRQLKKEKAEQREVERREASKLEATQKALNYVSKWKHAKTEWKFEKLRQIWLMDNLLDQTSVPDTIFPIVLEYFEGCKGMAREQLLKKGMDVIRKLEDEEEKQAERLESVEYKRARRLLQALPNDVC